VLDRDVGATGGEVPLQIQVGDAGHPWLHTWKDLLKEEQDFPYSAGAQRAGGRHFSATPNRSLYK